MVAAHGAALAEWRANVAVIDSCRALAGLACLACPEVAALERGARVVGSAEAELRRVAQLPRLPDSASAKVVQGGGVGGGGVRRRGQHHGSARV